MCCIICHHTFSVSLGMIFNIHSSKFSKFSLSREWLQLLMIIRPMPCVRSSHTYVHSSDMTRYQWPIVCHFHILQQHMMSHQLRKFVYHQCNHAWHHHPIWSYVITSHYTCSISAGGLGPSTKHLITLNPNISYKHCEFDYWWRRHRFVAYRSVIWSGTVGVVSIHDSWLATYCGRASRTRAFVQFSLNSSMVTDHSGKIKST